MSIRVDRDGPITTVILDQPERRHAEQFAGALVDDRDCSDSSGDDAPPSGGS